MNWAAKFTCIAVFLTSMLLIFAMGRTNVRHFKNVNRSIEEIYKDRLVVNGMIFELGGLLHKKELALATNDSLFFDRDNKSINLLINDIIKNFKETYLTDREAQTLKNFEVDTNKLQKLEQNLNVTSDKTKILSIIESLKLDLKTLSEIQLSEGRRKLASSDKAVDALETNQSIEQYSMMIIGFLIVLVLLLPVPKQVDN